MKSNYTTKQFAEFLRKLVIGRSDDADWRVSAMQDALDSNVAGYNEQYGTTGKWFFFEVSYRHGVNRTSWCGVYVGPKRTIVMECVGLGGKKVDTADEMFERTLRDVLAGR